MTLKKRNTAKMREIMTEQDIAAAKAIRRKKAAKLGMRFGGVSLRAGALLVVTTNKIFDEIFLKTTGRMWTGAKRMTITSSTNRQKE